MTLTPIKSRTTFGRRLFCYVPVALMACCCVTLLAVGISLALPYSYVSHFLQEPTVCTTRRILYRGNAACSCWQVDNMACRSRYPCVDVSVDYVDRGTGAIVYDATLYNQPFEYGTLKQDHCSTIACNRDPDVNNATVYEFVQQYGLINKTFPCYQGLESEPEVLLSVIKQWRVLLGMLIPTSLIGLAAIVVLFYYFVWPSFRSKMNVFNVN